ncbi:MAG: hypothetical protein ACFCUG_04780 [Thiotrichales bacterium]
MLPRELLGERFSPLFFLAALGAGGLSVSFFMYPMFLVAHPDTPMVTFNHLWPILTGDNLGAAAVLAAILALIVVFALLHFWLLAWNLRQYAAFRRSEAFRKLCQSNAEVTLMAIPLTLAMTINVVFVLGAVFVPNLWTIVEYLFPLALLAFFAVGVMALRILGDYFYRIIVHGDFSFETNNNFGQMIAIFALSMIAVGLAGPGAMSQHVGVNAIGIFLSIFFLSLALVLAVLKLVLGFKSILRHGIAVKTSSSLWIMIPILTLVGITVIRLNMGLHHGLNAELDNSSFFVLASVILSLQILVGLLGYKVMKRLGFFRDYVSGSKGDASTFSLICPGVAMTVFGIFFIHFALVKNGLIAHLSLAHLMLLVPFLLIQLKTIQVFMRLSCQHLSLGYGRCRLTPQPA